MTARNNYHTTLDQVIIWWQQIMKNTLNKKRGSGGINLLQTCAGPFIVLGWCKRKFQEVSWLRVPSAKPFHLSSSSISNLGSTKAYIAAVRARSLEPIASCIDRDLFYMKSAMCKWLGLLSQYSPPFIQSKINLLTITNLPSWIFNYQTSILIDNMPNWWVEIWNVE